jgi:hypothetical protein
MRAISVPGAALVNSIKKQKRDLQKLQKAKKQNKEMASDY